MATSQFSVLQDSVSSVLTNLATRHDADFAGKIRKRLFSYKHNTKGFYSSFDAFIEDGCGCRPIIGHRPVTRMSFSG